MGEVQGMKITKQIFGKLESGEEISVYTMSNKNGMQVSCIDYGAILKNVLVPDKKGNIKDVVLGYDTLEGYVKDNSALGSFIGRHANRIKDAKFQLNGITYELEKNDKINPMAQFSSHLFRTSYLQCVDCPKMLHV